MCGKSFDKCGISFPHVFFTCVARLFDVCGMVFFTYVPYLCYKCGMLFVHVWHIFLTCVAYRSTLVGRHLVTLPFPLGGPPRRRGAGWGRGQGFVWKAVFWATAPQTITPQTITPQTITNDCRDRFNIFPLANAWRPPFIPHEAARHTREWGGSYAKWRR